VPGSDGTEGAEVDPSDRDQGLATADGATLDLHMWGGGTEINRFVDGERHEHDTVVIATGLTPTGFASDSGLGDARGIPVRATLQHVDHDDIYAAGDAPYFTPGPLPKLGVHGVRQGPVLEHSLLARQDGRPLPVYEPHRHALQILDLGGGTALATRGRWWAEGPLLRRLKLAIDRRWLARYR
jgi:NADH dehydrogenase FAD-containing subunit